MLSKKQEEECIYIAVRISILIIVFCLSASIVHHVKYGNDIKIYNTTVSGDILGGNK